MSLTADTAALFVPYLPAGSTKIIKVAKAPVAKVVKMESAAIKTLKVEYKYLDAAATKYKHFLPASTKGKRWEKTLNKSAKFAPGTGDNAVRGYISAAMDAAKKEGKLKPSELSGHVHDFGKGKIVGAADGKCTSRIKLQVDSQGNIHAHPL